MKLLFSIVILIFSLISFQGTASPVECISTDGTWHTMANDPKNGNNIIIDGLTYRPLEEIVIGSKKKISTFTEDSGMIASVVLMVDPKTKNGDMYITIYADTTEKPELRLNLQCSI